MTSFMHIASIDDSRPWSSLNKSEVVSLFTIRLAL